MKISPRGAARLARPYLGSAKRSATRRLRSFSVSGKPARAHEKPAEGNEATREFLLGVALSSTGNKQGAVDRFAKSLQLDDRFGLRWKRFADDLRLLGRRAEAIDAYRNAVELRPSDHDAQAWLATLLLGRSAPKDATVTDVALSVGAEREDRDPLSNFLFALVNDAAGNHDVAHVHYVASLEASPDHPERQLRFARFEASRKRWDTAAAAYRRAVSEPESADTEAQGVLAMSAEALQSKIGTAAPKPEWSAVAAMARELIQRDPDDAQAHESLGLAAFHLQLWDDAKAALRIAVRSKPTDSNLLTRLATAAARSGDLEEAITARYRLVAVSPTGASFHRLALDLQQSGRTAEATNAFEHAIRLGSPNRSWFDQFGVALRKAARWAELIELYQTALATCAEDGQLNYLLGYALEQAGETDAARQAYERALELEPGRADWCFRLGYLHERFGPSRTVIRPYIGLQYLPTGELHLAAEMYRKSLALDPSQAGVWRRLGGVEEKLGNTAESRNAYQRLVDLDPKNASSWHLLGRSIAAVPNRRGMYHTDEHDELEQIWGRAIELDPNRSGSRAQLTRASIKAARWPLADDLAWFPTPAISSPSTESLLRGYLSGAHDSIEDLDAVLSSPSDELMWVPLEWWFPLHWKLLTDNHFSSAYRAKDLMAERIVSNGVPSIQTNLPGFLEYARALTFLGRRELAMSVLTPSATADIPRESRAALEHHAASVALLMGDPSLHVAARDVAFDPHVAVSEERFRELIEGKRVAIVGPGHSDEASGPEIDGHDVVIRTKYTSDQLADHVEMAGSRTDISYYALGSAQFLKSDITEALASNDLKMAVFRTSTYTATPPHLVRPGDVRYVPSEYLIGLRSSQFAIQRIFYDVVRYHPASIKVFNIDFFLSPDAYRPGYVADYAAKAENEGFIKVLGAFGHDFRADFEFTQAMHEYGLLDGDNRIRQILQLSSADYLAGLDRRRVAPASPLVRR